MDTSQIQPLELFRELENESQGNSVLGEEQPFVESWRGFVFNVDELSLVVPFIGQFEILPCGELWPLPLAKRWVKGMTNIRGEIYTVVDFSDFIGRKPIKSTKGSNLFVLSDSPLKSALLLSSKINLRPFNHDMPRADLKDIEPRLRSYLSSVLIEGPQRWCVIDIRTLTNSEDFLNIGI